ncbi:SdpA family antimicrobial peptide system protein [Subtercola sp. RTI3]|uniref:SdpA family antimicrobial peptide system protein n=1 Tax=Subtercola sp. RTI3 TaxID=3048639 RepID=UPI002B227567|nr:SdpA family antimicrobial peptide system protein [Subtercola sp. RTI3]MEA9984600.1 SdpA family antimicrobial peptide system protein [Subtercola sp. RTI3]
MSAFVFDTNQPDNVLTSTWQTSIKPVVQTILPEQWGFFTKSPRDDVILPYSYSNGLQWSAAGLYPHSRAEFAFGLNRVSRAQGVEVGIIYKAVLDENGTWTDCDEGTSALDCLTTLAAKPGPAWVTVANPSPDPTICGKAALSKAEPIPWAYANIGQADQSISVVLVEVTCSTS